MKHSDFDFDSWTCQRASDESLVQFDFFYWHNGFSIQTTWNDFAILIGLDNGCAHCILYFPVVCLRHNFDRGEGVETLRTCFVSTEQMLELKELKALHSQPLRPRLRPTVTHPSLVRRIHFSNQKPHAVATSRRNAVAAHRCYRRWTKYSNPEGKSGMTPLSPNVNAER